MADYTEAIAFIVEGTTEKVFYTEYLEYLSKCNNNIVLTKEKTVDGDVYYCWQYDESRILIKFYVVGAITQIVHSGKWFRSMCSKKHKVPWTVYLCYDTDSYSSDITKFYEGDWKTLRRELKKYKADRIIDLAASADIEDIMLCDIESILNFLDIEMPEKISGRKGKAKMKALFRLAGRFYHEGERAKELISRLDFEIITNTSPVQLDKLKCQLIK